MKILSIQTSNFRLHADSAFDFPGHGVVGIIGSNESGKSTVLEALLWALFGTAATRGTKGSLRWNRAPARHTASVTLRFAVGGKTYTLERGENTARLVDEGANVCVAESTSGVDSYVPGLLGMTHEEFRASFLCSQRDLNRIAAMGPTERQAFIRSVLGVGKIDEALKTCRARKNELASEKAGIEAGLGERGPLEEAKGQAEAEVRAAKQFLEDTTEEVKKAESALVDAASALRKMEERKRDHDNLSLELRDAKNAVLGHTNRTERLKKDLQDAYLAADRVKSSIEELSSLRSLRDERDSLRDARVQKDERDTLERTVHDLREDIAEIDAKIEEAEEWAVRLDDVRSARDSANQRVNDLRHRYTKLRDTRLENKARCEAAARAARKEAGRLEAQSENVSSLGAEGACPTCTRVLGEALDAVLEGLGGEIHRQREIEHDAGVDAESFAEPEDDEIETEIALNAAMDDAQVGDEQVRRAKDAQAKLQRLQPERERVLGRLRVAEKRLQELPAVKFDEGRLRAVESEVRRLEVLDSSLIQTRATASLIPDIKAAIEEEGHLVDESKKRVDGITTDLEDLAFDSTAYDGAKGAHELARKDVEDARISRARAEESKNGSVAALSRALKALEAYDERADTLASIVEQYRLHEKVDARLSDFRVAVAGTIRPELEELVSGFVHLLTDGRHEAVTLSDDFAPILHESGVPTEVVSGGTEDITAIAMRLAISQMIAERAGHPLSLLILDEPFGSLDETRRGNVLGLIQRLRGVFDQVVVISHVAETRDAVDHVIELEYDEVAGKTLVSDPSPVMAVA